MSFNRVDAVRDTIDVGCRLYLPEGVIYVGTGMGQALLSDKVHNVWISC